MTDHHHDSCGCHHDHGDHSHKHNHQPHSEKAPQVITKILEGGRVDCNPSDPLKVVKTIKKEGKGDVIPLGSIVNVHYTGTLENGNKFDSSRDRNQPFSFELGKGKVIKGWDLGVATMKVGEIADFSIKYDYAYGEQGSPPTIPPKASLNFNVELLSFEKQPVTVQEKLAYGLETKTIGNDLVVKKEWGLALNAYEKGLNVLIGMTNENEEIQKKHRELVISLYLNKALACLKLDRYVEAFQASEEVLKLDNNCGKAYYRRAMCFESREEWQNAKRDLYYAAICSPNDKGIRAELERVKGLVKQEDDKDRKKYSNLFERLKHMETEEEKKKLLKETKEADEKEKREAEIKIEGEKKKENITEGEGVAEKPNDTPAVEKVEETK